MVIIMMMLMMLRRYRAGNSCGKRRRKRRNNPSVTHWGTVLTIAISCWYRTSKIPAGRAISNPFYPDQTKKPIGSDKQNDQKHYKGNHLPQFSAQISCHKALEESHNQPPHNGPGDGIQATHQHGGDGREAKMAV
jgi:hypothetical protein